ncbi:FAD dependent oxidoreductase [Mytilinidion resinicola]|uniref:FAD dependent oxidoreductase n=1 Tax=Mytilinidion resinicola TaxID=574789 RepID=A0A6A6YW70_9PEZI|nr:FAD dependent oxidoreductase [Mytilinidion resinicola]KAF2813020.1 FAD dependent oxidoreductase [Mytilinidion resinicola]
MSASPEFTVLGAGVIGLSTALTLSTTFPTAPITITATHFPGDRAAIYASPWAGANWLSVATDGGAFESYDRITFEKFDELERRRPECGIKRMGIKAVFDNVIEEAGVLSVKEGGGLGEKLWYEELVGGLRMLGKEEVPEGAKWGMEIEGTFVVNTQVYLPWLQNEALKKGIKFVRRSYPHIDDVSRDFPQAAAVFNCTGLGSYSLGGVEDHDLYPTRGQVVLVAEPKTPISKMYFRSPKRVDPSTTYVFPRPLGGGVILGGCRQEGNWDGDVDLEFAEDIMRRCCALCPELGKPEELQVISHGVGLRPSRKGNARIEGEQRGSVLVVHNYGASGAGYQASWGMAARGVDIAKQALTLTSKL